MYIRPNPRIASCWIALLGAALSIWMAVPRALAIDGIVGPIAWNVPFSPYQVFPQSEPSEERCGSWPAMRPGPAPRSPYFVTGRRSSFELDLKLSPMPHGAVWPAMLRDVAAGVDAHAASSELLESQCLWLTDSTPAAAAACLDPARAFDAERFARLARGSYFTAAPAAECEAVFYMERRGFLGEAPSLTSSCLVDRTALLDDGEAQGANNLPRQFSLAAIHHRAAGPAGTMYLWSIVPDATDQGDPFSPSARRAPSAGVVLTRPPGDYSLDWIGVAVTAPIH